MKFKTSHLARAVARACTCWALAGIAAGTAQAAPRTLTGTQFDIVYDDSLLATSLYNEPLMLGNTVVFTPTQLLAMSLDGEGLVEEHSAFGFQIRPHAGFRLDTLLLTERGDYELEGQHSWAGLQGTASVTDTLNPLATASGTLSFSSGPFSPNAGSGTVHNWSASTLIDVGDRPEFARTGAVDFAVSNRLQAYTASFEEGARFAFIQKKFSGETITLTVATAVPEPHGAALLLGGLALLALATRRRG